jgi:hypothetical protein
MYPLRFSKPQGPRKTFPVYGESFLNAARISSKQTETSSESASDEEDTTINEGAHSKLDIDPFGKTEFEGYGCSDFDPIEQAVSGA